MITGQLMVYWYNTRRAPNRNLHSIRDIHVHQASEFRQHIQDALDEVPPGKGYVLIKWIDKMFIAERDSTNPKVDYVRHEIKYHPLMNRFTI